MEEDKNLVITGCQRSGTTIYTKMLCHDLGREFIQDDQFYPNIEVWKSFKDRTNLAIQSPLSLYLYLDVYYYFSNIHFIGMKRDKEDILNSIRRVDLFKDYITNDYEEYINNHVDHMIYLWDRLKETLPEDAWSEVEYSSLESHELYIPKEERTNFTLRQTMAPKPVKNPGRTAKFYRKNKASRDKHRADELARGKTPAKKKYRAELKAERVRRGINGKGGSDLSHKNGKIQSKRESIKANRGRGGARKR